MRGIAPASVTAAARRATARRTGASIRAALGFRAMLRVAALVALFGILILESLGAQVIQSGTARLVAQYRARDEEAALHMFVRRWTTRVLVGASAPALIIVVAAPAIAPALSLPVLSVALLGL